MGAIAISPAPKAVAHSTGLQPGPTPGCEDDASGTDPKVSSPDPNGSSKQHTFSWLMKTMYHFPPGYPIVISGESWWMCIANLGYPGTARS